MKSGLIITAKHAAVGAGTILISVIIMLPIVLYIPKVFLGIVGALFFLTVSTMVGSLICDVMEDKRRKKMLQQTDRS
jgi:hypothetical protein